MTKVELALRESDRMRIQRPRPNEQFQSLLIGLRTVRVRSPHSDAMLRFPPQHRYLFASTVERSDGYPFSKRKTSLNCRGDQVLAYGQTVPDDFADSPNGSKPSLIQP